jgi:hypothetical protein
LLLGGVLRKFDLGLESTYSRRKDAYSLVANSLVSISKQNIAAAVGMLEAAQRLQPEDKFIGAFLLEMCNYVIRASRRTRGNKKAN